MSSVVDVEVRLKMRDGAAAGIKAVSQTAQQEAAKTATATEKAAQKAAEATEKGLARQRSSHEKLSHARETLGVRSERAIQREIQQTEAAYNRLTASGKLSAVEQARAYDAVKSKVTRLTHEMGKLTAEQKKAAAEAANLERGQRVLRTGAAVAAGVGAAAYTLKAPAMSAMAYDEQIGLLANTAFAEYDKSGRKTGEARIREAITQAIGTGMARGDALAALNKLIADNQVGGVAGALDLLPFIGKVSTGSGSAGVDVAAMMGSFIGAGYANDAEGAKRLMGISSAAATAGAFEKDDMAKHLPTLLPLAKSVGLAGEDGFRRLLVLLQQARTTAGSSDEAATNVRNLLTKLTSDETAKNFLDAGRGDLYQHLMSQRAQGVDPLTAWQNVIDAEIARNPNIKPALAKVQGAKSKDEQDAAIEALTGMAEGQGIGRFFRDMQARGALFGMRNKAVEGEVNNAIARSARTITEVDYESMADRAGFKTRVASERGEMAKITAMDGMTPAIGKVAELFGDMAAKYPLLVGTTTVAATALAALAGAAGLASLAMGGKIPGVGAIGKYAGKLPGLASGALAGAPGLLAAGARLTGAVGLAGAVGYGFGSLLNLGINKGVQWRTGDQNQSLGGWIYDLLHKENNPLVQNLKPSADKPKLDASLHVVVSDDRVSVKSTRLDTFGVNAQMNTGNLYTGAP